MSSKILIYTTDRCYYCVQAKRYFQDHGLVFEEVDLTNQFSVIDELKRQTGHRTIPLIFVNDIFIGGYTDMIEKISRGELSL